MSGTYDLKMYAGKYYDENCYFNSPVDYMPRLNDEGILNQLRAKKHLHFVAGQGNYEAPEILVEMGDILTAKGIPNEVDLWGYDMPHDWPTWRKMLPHYLQTRF